MKIKTSVLTPSLNQELTKSSNQQSRKFKFLVWANLAIQFLLPIATAFSPAIAASLAEKQRLEQQEMLANNEGDTQIGEWLSTAGNTLAAEDSKQAAAGLVRSAAESKASGTAQDWFNQFGTSRVQLSLDEKFHYKGSSIDWLLPLYDTDSWMLFNQLGWRDQSDDKTLNLGLGVRYFQEDVMYGLNSFYDHNLSESHRRYGFGAELWRDYVKLAANAYLGLSDWRKSDVTDYDARPANGYDLRAEGYLPSFPQLGSKLMYEKYYGDEVALFGKDNRQKNPSAWTLGLNYTPIPLATLGVEQRYGQGGKSDTTANLQFTYQFGQTLLQQLDPASVQHKRTLMGSRYDLVERNNNIVLQYKKQAPAEEVAGFRLVADSQPFDGTPITITATVNGSKALAEQETVTFQIVENDADASMSASFASVETKQTGVEENLVKTQIVTLQDGSATVFLQNSAPGTVEVTATIEGRSENVVVRFKIPDAELEVTSNIQTPDDELFVNTGDTIKLTTEILDSEGNPMRGLVDNSSNPRLVFDAQYANSPSTKRANTSVGTPVNFTVVEDSGEPGKYTATLTGNHLLGTIKVVVRVDKKPVGKPIRIEVASNETGEIKWDDPSPPSVVVNNDITIPLQTVVSTPESNLVPYQNIELTLQRVDGSEFDWSKISINGISGQVHRLSTGSTGKIDIKIKSNDVGTFKIAAKNMGADENATLFDSTVFTFTADLTELVITEPSITPGFAVVASDKITISTSIKRGGQLAPDVPYEFRVIKDGVVAQQIEVTADDIQTGSDGVASAAISSKDSLDQEVTIGLYLNNSETAVWEKDLTFTPAPEAVTVELDGSNDVTANQQTQLTATLKSKGQQPINDGIVRFSFKDTDKTIAQFVDDKFLQHSTIDINAGENGVATINLKGIKKGNVQVEARYVSGGTEHQSDTKSIEVLPLPEYQLVITEEIERPVIESNVNHKITVTVESAGSDINVFNDGKVILDVKHASAESPVRHSAQEIANGRVQFTNVILNEPGDYELTASLVSDVNGIPSIAHKINVLQAVDNAKSTFKPDITESVIENEIILTATINDKNNQPITGLMDKDSTRKVSFNGTLTSTSSSGKLESTDFAILEPTETAPGVYTATITPKALGTLKIEAFVGEVKIGDTKSIEIVNEDETQKPALAFVNLPTSIQVDTGQNIEVQVTGTTDFITNINGKQVSFSATGAKPGSVSFDPFEGTIGADGKAISKFTATEAGTYTLTAVIAAAETGGAGELKNTGTIIVSDLKPSKDHSKIILPAEAAGDFMAKEPFTLTVDIRDSDDNPISGLKDAISFNVGGGKEQGISLKGSDVEIVNIQQIGSVYTAKVTVQRAGWLNIAWSVDGEDFGNTEEFEIKAAGDVKLTVQQLNVTTDKPIIASLDAGLGMNVKFVALQSNNAYAEHVNVEQETSVIKDNRQANTASFTAIDNYPQTFFIALIDAETETVLARQKVSFETNLNGVEMTEFKVPAQIATGSHRLLTADLFIDKHPVYPGQVIFSFDQKHADAVEFVDHAGSKLAFENTNGVISIKRNTSTGGIASVYVKGMTAASQVAITAKPAGNAKDKGLSQNIDVVTVVEEEPVRIKWFSSIRNPSSGTIFANGEHEITVIGQVFKQHSSDSEKNRTITLNVSHSYPAGMSKTEISGLNDLNQVTTDGDGKFRITIKTSEYGKVTVAAKNKSHSDDVGMPATFAYNPADPTLDFSLAFVNTLPTLNYLPDAVLGKQVVLRVGVRDKKRDYAPVQGVNLRYQAKQVGLGGIIIETAQAPHVKLGHLVNHFPSALGTSTDEFGLGHDIVYKPLNNFDQSFDMFVALGPEYKNRLIFRKTHTFYPVMSKTTAADLTTPDDIVIGKEVQKVTAKLMSVGGKPVNFGGTANKEKGRIIFSFVEEHSPAQFVDADGRTEGDGNQVTLDTNAEGIASVYVKGLTGGKQVKIKAKSAHNEKDAGVVSEAIDVISESSITINWDTSTPLVGIASGETGVTLTGTVKKGPTKPLADQQISVKAEHSYSLGTTTLSGPEGQNVITTDANGKFTIIVKTEEYGTVNVTADYDGSVSKTIRTNFVPNDERAKQLTVDFKQNNDAASKMRALFGASKAGDLWSNMIFPLGSLKAIATVTDPVRSSQLVKDLPVKFIVEGENASDNVKLEGAEKFTDEKGTVTVTMKSPRYFDLTFNLGLVLNTSTAQPLLGRQAIKFLPHPYKATVQELTVGDGGDNLTVAGDKTTVTAHLKTVGKQPISGDIKFTLNGDVGAVKLFKDNGAELTLDAEKSVIIPAKDNGEAVVQVQGVTQGEVEVVARPKIFTSEAEFPEINNNIAPVKIRVSNPLSGSLTFSPPKPGIANNEVPVEIVASVPQGITEGEVIFTLSEKSQAEFDLGGKKQTVAIDRNGKAITAIRSSVVGDVEVAATMLGMRSSNSVKVNFQPLPNREASKFEAYSNGAKTNGRAVLNKDIKLVAEINDAGNTPVKDLMKTQNQQVVFQAKFLAATGKKNASPDSVTVEKVTESEPGKYSATISQLELGREGTLTVEAFLGDSNSNSRFLLLGSFSTEIVNRVENEPGIIWTTDFIKPVLANNEAELKLTGRLINGHGREAPNDTIDLVLSHNYSKMDFKSFTLRGEDKGKPVTPVAGSDNKYETETNDQGNFVVFIKASEYGNLSITATAKDNRDFTKTKTVKFTPDLQDSRFTVMKRTGQGDSGPNLNQLHTVAGHEGYASPIPEYGNLYIVEINDKLRPGRDGNIYLSELGDVSVEIKVYKFYQSGTPAENVLIRKRMDGSDILFDVLTQNYFDQELSIGYTLNGREEKGRSNFRIKGNLTKATVSELKGKSTSVVVDEADIELEAFIDSVGKTNNFANGVPQITFRFDTSAVGGGVAKFVKSNGQLAEEVTLYTSTNSSGGTNREHAKVKLRGLKPGNVKIIAINPLFTADPAVPDIQEKGQSLEIEVK